MNGADPNAQKVSRVKKTKRSTPLVYKTFFPLLKRGAYPLTQRKFFRIIVAQCGKSVGLFPNYSEKSHQLYRAKTDQLTKDSENNFI